MSDLLLAATVTKLTSLCFPNWQRSMTGTVPSGASTLAASREMSCFKCISDYSDSSSAIPAHLVDVDGRSEVVVGQDVVVPHTNLTEVTRMELVEVGSVVVLTTGLTSTTRRLPVLADTTVTGRDVSSVLSSVGESGRHLRRRGALDCGDRSRRFAGVIWVMQSVLPSFLPAMCGFVVPSSRISSLRIP